MELAKQVIELFDKYNLWQLSIDKYKIRIPPRRIRIEDDIVSPSLSVTINIGTIVISWIHNYGQRESINIDIQDLLNTIKLSDLLSNNLIDGN